MVELRSAVVVDGTEYVVDADAHRGFVDWGTVRGEEFELGAWIVSNVDPSQQPKLAVMVAGELVKLVSANFRRQDFRRLGASIDLCGYQFNISTRFAEAAENRLIEYFAI
jgi:hypothetical protein